MAAGTTREFFAPLRLLAFSDGVFGVVITLLVIDLRFPATETGAGDPARVSALLGMAPNLLIFVFTFLVVGMSWLGHHRKFSYVGKIDNGLLWLNLLYLMTLCLVPFVTSILTGHGGRVAFILYAVLMGLVSLLSGALSVYAFRPAFLADPDMAPGSRRDMTLSPLLTGGAFLVAAGLAFANWNKLSHWSLLVIVPVAILFGSRGHAGLPVASGVKRRED
ncbi:MAG TPA: TMEM175 family protein [Stellaceae bacterium]|jgi:uncharacterized membrane protein